MIARFERSPGLRPLARRDYRLLLAGSVLVGILMPFHMMTQLFWVNHEYPERAVLYSGILAASRGAAMVLLSLVGGAIADRVERRRVLLVCETISLGAHTVIAALMLFQPFGEWTVAAVAGWTFLAAGVQSVDSPARSASLPAAAGPENVRAGIALLSVANQLTMPISLPLVGILNQLMPSGAVYAASLLAWVGIIPMISLLRFQSRGGAMGASVVANIRDGLRYARRSRPIFATLSIVMVVQVLGMPVAAPLGPMFEIEVLGFNSAQVGLMGATWGLGSLTASIGLAKAGGLTLRGSTLATVSVLFGVAALGFGYSRFVPLTAASDYGMGFAFTGTMLVASTLVQHLVDDSMRGRVLSLFPFTMGIAQVGNAVAGALGQRIGLATLLPALGWAEIAGCVVVLLIFRELVRASVRRPAPPVEPEPAAGPA